MKGWNVYIPTICICYHDYTNNLLESSEKVRPLVWEDTTIDSSKVNNLLNHLYKKSDGIRTAVDYQIYMGFNYENKKIIKSANDYIKNREMERDKYFKIEHQ